jgi:hypothetical protein
MFTRQTLRGLANDNSYQRGRAYYDDGAVRQLRRDADTFHATVRGSSSYRVQLRLAAAGLEFRCSCPYEFGGICKHAVALGLAVLDAYGPNLTSAGAATSPAAPGAMATAVKAAWADRKKADKLRFLKQALAKNDDLARQFLAFGSQPEPASHADMLATLADRLTDTLETLEFDEEFWENSEEYYEEDEGDSMSEAVTNALRDALASFVAELLGLARAGQLTAALRYWATACAAIYQVEEPGSDDYGQFGDYGTDVLRHWHEDLQAAGWPELLLTVVIPPAELKAALKWLGAYLAKPPTAWPDFEASWQPLLLALAADPIAAPLLTPHLAQAPLSADTRARLALQTARTLPNDEAWRKAAETLLPTDAAVAQQLLNYYANQADRPALLRTATKAFSTWPDRFADYVLSTFGASQAPDLYRDALRYRALANSSRADFERLRPLLRPDQISGFVAAARHRYPAQPDSLLFVATLLHEEAEPAALLNFVLGLEWPFARRPADFEQALALAAATSPTPLMLALEERAEAYLRGRANTKRGHDLYHRLAGWLHTATQAAPQLREPVLRLAQHLRAEFPTLYGLREALRAVKLLPPK